MELSQHQKQIIIDSCRRHDIEFCAVFGSFARGEASEVSDLDLLVRFSKPKGIDWLDAAMEIEDALGIKVDLVTEKSLHPFLVEGVEKDLFVLYGERRRGPTPAYA